MAKELDIFNSTPRVVVCTQAKEEDYYFPNASKLKEGEKYHLSRLEVFSWHTDVYLKEFPGCRFNSVQFEEVED